LLVFWLTPNRFEIGEMSRSFFGKRNMKQCFLHLVSFARQILYIVGSWIIKTKKIFSLVGILTNLQRCRLQIGNLKSWYLCIKINLVIDPKVGCKTPSSLVEFIEINGNLRVGIWGLVLRKMKLLSVLLIEEKNLSNFNSDFFDWM